MSERVVEQRAAEAGVREVGLYQAEVVEVGNAGPDHRAKLKITELDHREEWARPLDSTMAPPVGKLVWMMFVPQGAGEFEHLYTWDKPTATDLESLVAATQAKPTPPAWQAGRQYSIDELVHHQKATSRCIKGHTSSQDDNPHDGKNRAEHWLTTGMDGQPTTVLVRGAWVKDNRYSPGHIVLHTNGTWLCIKDHQATANTNPHDGQDQALYWTKLADGNSELEKSIATQEQRLSKNEAEVHVAHQELYSLLRTVGEPRIVKMQPMRGPVRTKVTCTGEFFHTGTRAVVTWVEFAGKVAEDLHVAADGKTLTFKIPVGTPTGLQPFSLWQGDTGVIDRLLWAVPPWFEVTAS